jgi:hypothetical protein
VSKIEKLLDKTKNNPQNIRFNEICKLAEAFGFTCRGGKGNHTIYSRKGVIELINFQNVYGMAKPYQVRQFLRIVEEYSLKIRGE